MDAEEASQRIFPGLLRMRNALLLPVQRAATHGDGCPLAVVVDECIPVQQLCSYAP